MIKIELVYVSLDRATVHLKLELSPGATVGDALMQSDIYNTHPETKGMKVGVYAKLVDLDTVLKEGDRVEIYRSLSFDPKENRRKRARLKL